MPETRLERAILYAAILARQGTRQLVAHRAPQMAAALAYRTIFSLVPILALALVVLNAFYQREGVERLFAKIFEWTGIDEIEVEGERVADYLGTYISVAANRVSEINFGVITVVGAALLIYAALSLVIQVETSFNTICRAPRGRKMLIRLTYYWTIITLGSLGLVLSFTIGQGYQRLLENMPTWAAWLTLPAQLFMRVGVTWLILLIAYRLLPNTRVSAKFAAVGALVAAVLWEAAKSALTWFIVEMTDGNVQIYGSLAILPLFLLWIYFTWLIVLFGLEVTSAMQWLTREHVRRVTLGHEDPVAFDPADGVAMLVRVAQGFAAGRAVTLQELSEDAGLPGSALERCVAAFVKEGYLHDVAQDDDEAAYCLARPPESIAVRQVLASGYEMRGEDDLREDVRRVRELMLDAPGDRTIADLMRSEG